MTTTQSRTSSIPTLPPILLAIDRASTCYKHTPSLPFSTQTRMPRVDLSGQSFIHAYSKIISPRPKVKQPFDRAARFKKDELSPRVPMSHMSPKKTSSLNKAGASAFGRSPRVTMLPLKAAITSHGLMPVSAPASRSQTPRPPAGPPPSMSAPASRRASRVASRVASPPLDDGEARPPSPPSVMDAVDAPRAPQRARRAARKTPKSEAEAAAAAALEQQKPQHKAKAALAQRAHRLEDVPKDELFGDTPCDVTLLKRQLVQQVQQLASGAC